MYRTRSMALRLSLFVPAIFLGACSEDSPLSPTEHAVSTLKRVTAQYKDVEAAIADGFFMLHPCEERDEGPVGTVYVHMERLLDGVIDPELPDALIYEPAGAGKLVLVGVEFALPYALWTSPQPPQFLGAPFQREDEFEVFALHAWVWRDNPAGMFAPTNARVSCSAT